MTDVCLRCGRVPSDLIHDNPNDHGWTGTSAMHPFLDERGKWLLQWTAKNVFLRGKSGQKGGRLTDEQVKWNKAIGAAESAVAAMFAPLTPDDLAKHDRYFADEYGERAASALVARTPGEK